MSYRLTKIYTRQGDEGFTTFGGKSISKDDLMIDVVGNLDELNSTLGMILAEKMPNNEMKTLLLQIQNELFNLGGELHTPEFLSMSAAKTAQLEKELDALNETLPPLKEFVLPGGNRAAAACHLARTVCRRTERSLVRLHRQVSLHNPEMLCYLNRLGDLLFVLARIFARTNETEEMLWEHERHQE